MHSHDGVSTGYQYILWLGDASISTSCIVATQIQSRFWWGLSLPVSASIPNNLLFYYRRVSSSHACQSGDLSAICFPCDGGKS
jgi:hypothetical protein